MTRRLAVFAVLAALAFLAVAALTAAPAYAQIDPPAPPTVPAPAADEPTISIDLGGGGSDDSPSSTVVMLLGLTVLAVAPSILIMTTSFTRIVIVLSLTRNALGLPTIPPNQVIVGLAMFLSLFVMSPTLSEMNEDGLQPYLDGEMEQTEAIEAASGPLKQFMLDNTRQNELAVFLNASGADKPESADDVGFTELVPAFILSELKTAFIIGFVVFVPFLVIDLVVSAILMSLGMMMLPPVFVSLPFKILLFVMVNGWTLVASSLMQSFN